MANATVASTILGYPKGTVIAQKAVTEGKTVKQVIRELKLFSDEEIDKLFDTLMMTDWRQSGKILATKKF